MSASIEILTKSKPGKLIKCDYDVSSASYIAATHME